MLSHNIARVHYYPPTCVYVQIILGKNISLENLFVCSSRQTKDAELALKTSTNAVSRWNDIDIMWVYSGIEAERLRVLYEKLEFFVGNYQGSGGKAPCNVLF